MTRPFFSRNAALRYAASIGSIAWFHDGVWLVRLP